MTKEEIKNLYSMKDILERYGLPQPNRAGFICCPFHKEKTASMKIYKDSCYCFGCNFGGDIFDFVQKMDRISFKEAYAALGGDYENNFSIRLKIYQAQKKREMQIKREKELEKERELNYLMMDIWRNLLKNIKPLTDEWADIFKKLQSQEYLWEMLNDQEECYETVEHIKQERNSVRGNI